MKAIEMYFITLLMTALCLGVISYTCAFPTVKVRMSVCFYLTNLYVSVAAIRLSGASGSAAAQHLSP